MRFQHFVEKKVEKLVLDKSKKMLYNLITVGQEVLRRTGQENFSKKFEKVLDKPGRKCYNIKAVSKEVVE